MAWVTGCNPTVNPQSQKNNAGLANWKVKGVSLLSPLLHQSLGREQSSCSLDERCHKVHRKQCMASLHRPPANSSYGSGVGLSRTQHNDVDVVELKLSKYRDRVIKACNYWYAIIDM